MRRSAITRIVSALAVGALLAVGQVSGAGSVAASPSGDDGYHHSHDGDRHDGYRKSSKVETWTDVSVYSSRTVCATVSSHSGTPRGSVTFYLSGYSSATKYLSYGKACATLPSSLVSGKTYRVAARYNGQYPWLPSWDSEYFTVKKYYDHDHNKYDHDRHGYKHDDHDGYKNDDDSKKNDDGHKRYKHRDRHSYDPDKRYHSDDPKKRSRQVRLREQALQHEPDLQQGQGRRGV